MAIAANIAKARFRSFSDVLSPLHGELHAKHFAEKLHTAAGAPQIDFWIELSLHAQFQVVSVCPDGHVLYLLAMTAIEPAGEPKDRCQSLDAPPIFRRKLAKICMLRLRSRAAMIARHVGNDLELARAESR